MGPVFNGMPKIYFYHQTKDEMFIPKAVIFDLGGVIINLNYNATAEAFKNLGIANFDDVYSKQKQERLFDDFEKGIITPTQFRERIRKHISHPVRDIEIDRAWDAMLLDIPSYRIQWLNKLRKRYRIFLLSNTNEIHITGFTNILLDCFGENVFETIFEKIYYSCYLNKRKPDHEIFERVLNDNKLLKEETLFVDDSEQHITAAKQFGLHTLQLQTNGDISKELNYLLA